MKDSIFFLTNILLSPMYLALYQVPDIYLQAPASRTEADRNVK